jgi:hypothetical protein
MRGDFDEDEDPDFEPEWDALGEDDICADCGAVPARAHQEEKEDENDEGVSRVGGERLSEGQELPRKPPTGCQ